MTRPIITALLVASIFLLSACHDEQGPQAKKCDGGKPFSVPEQSETLWLLSGSLCLIVAARRLLKP